MTSSPKAFAALAAPFPPAAVSWRVGSTTKDKSKGMALAYIDARDVMDRLDEAVGPGAWSDRYEVHGTRVVCTISIKIGDEWVSKSDGAGDTDVEAEKGAISDAFKRAAVKWGVGRYLYALAVPWVALDANGKSIAKSEYAKLTKLLPGSAVAPSAAEDVNPFAPDEAEIERDELIRLVNGCQTIAALRELWSSARVDNFCTKVDPVLSDPVTAAKDARRTALLKQKEAA